MPSSSMAECGLPWCRAVCCACGARLSPPAGNAGTCSNLISCLHTTLVCLVAVGDAGREAARCCQSSLFPSVLLSVLLSSLLQAMQDVKQLASKLFTQGSPLGEWSACCEACLPDLC